MSSAIVFRCDADDQIGAGHAMRCLALGQVLRDAGRRVFFASNVLLPAIRDRLCAEAMSIVDIAGPVGSDSDAAATIRLCRELECDTVVCDGYRLLGPYRHALGRAGLDTMVIDDLGFEGDHGDRWLLNQNAYAARDQYRDTTSELLLGTRYALLRREISSHRRRDDFAGPVRRVLATIGGSAQPQTLRCVAAAAQVLANDGIHTTILGTRPSGVGTHSGVEWRPFVTDMAELYEGTDLVIGACGSTVWETSYFGIPSVIVSIADNQLPNAHELDARGTIQYLGAAESISSDRIAAAVLGLADDSEKRARMARAARELIDGRGAVRAAAALGVERALHLRPVEHADRDLVYRWANDSLTREMAFSADAIPHETHCQWFEERLASSDLFWIAELADGSSVGQIRFEQVNAGAVVHLNLAPEHRGRRLSTPLIRAGSRCAAQQLKAPMVLAYIKRDNEPSAKAFVRAGYELSGQTSRAGVPVNIFSWRLPA